jgi:hypothetical protein
MIRYPDGATSGERFVVGDQKSLLAKNYFIKSLDCKLFWNTNNGGSKTIWRFE